MYFPYLRGRQFELIALRELIERELISGEIIPLIEPVKLSPTLLKTMKIFEEKGRKIAIVHNPKVGNFKNDFGDKNENENLYYSYLDSDESIIVHALNKESLHEIAEITDKGLNVDKLAILINSRDDLEYYDEIRDKIEPLYGFGPDDRQVRRAITKNRILLEDRFNKLPRNADYLDLDEFFSEDHIYFNDEGYIGFSDYSIVGDEYSESGFAPYSVAIHFVYFDTDNSLRVIHFVSDSNSDIKDPGGKFYEAVTKLYDWQVGKGIDTFALREFIKLYKDGGYPGLGTIKKLSIMHHLELMSQYLTRAN